MDDLIYLGDLVIPCPATEEQISAAFASIKRKHYGTKEIRVYHREAGRFNQEPEKFVISAYGLKPSK